MDQATADISPSRRPVEGTVLKILMALSFSHMLNDMIQSLLPAIYPLLKDSFHLNFTQVGLITFSFQFTASLLRRSLVFTPTVARILIHWPLAWVSRSSGWCCCRVPAVSTPF